MSVERRNVTALAALALCACGPPPKPPHVPQPPKVEASLALPNNDGRVHVVVIPGDVGEQQRCIVATTPAGHVSTSCAPKEIAPAPDQ